MFTSFTIKYIFYNFYTIRIPDYNYCELKYLKDECHCEKCPECWENAH